jgi:hypothetical protein
MRFARFGQVLVRRRRIVLVLAALFFLAAGAYGGDVATRLSSGGFDATGADSTEAAAYLADTLGTGTPNVVLLVTPSRSGVTVDDAAVAAAGTAVTEQLASEPGVTQAVSYWTLGRAARCAAARPTARWCSPGWRGRDVVKARVGELSDACDRQGRHRDDPGRWVHETFREVGHTIEKDLQLADSSRSPSPC